MSTGNLTFTGTLGPGNSVTSLVFANVKSIRFNLEKDVIEVYYGDPVKFQTLDYSTTATITYTIASGVATITVS